MKISDSDLRRAYAYDSWKRLYPILSRYVRLYAVDHMGMRRPFKHGTQLYWYEFLGYYLEDSNLPFIDRDAIYKGDLSPLVALEEKRTKNFQQLYTAIDAKVEDSVDFILSLTQN